MFPNERLSLDDCHLRYYRYGDSTFVAPVAALPAYLKEFAHMAAIGWTQPDGSISWKCGGSLILENYVLTAAHCTQDNGTAPDVARFGDINIFSDEDDQFAQQLKIVEIIRHPEFKFALSYNDIALLRLEKNVTLHETVSPACLWTEEEEVRFPSLQATGWGDTGFALARTPSLLKVTLKPITNEECSSFYSSANRKLRDGLKASQICAGDERMDTCPGDSGGPLQIKLLHNGRISPFLVGITSFGVACGISTPGVYTRVSAFYKWILDTLQSKENNVHYWSLEPISCALRYVHLREYEDDVITSRKDGWLSIDSSKAHMQKAGRELNHKVEIGWKDGYMRRDNCSGTIIADDTVLTLAECASHFGVPPSHVVINAFQENFEIAEIHVHPQYRENSLYNNIAVLILKDRAVFTDTVKPVCIWHSADIPDPQLEVAAVGRLDINDFYFVNDAFKPTDINLLPRLSVNSPQNCTIPKEFRSRLTRGLASEHLCVGDPLFLIPQTCRLLYGAPMQRRIWRNRRHFQYAYGLNVFGRDCGFGEAAVATRLVSHVDWLKTILLPNIRDGESAVQFINPDWKENDHCDYDYDDTEESSICTHYTRCPKVWDDFKAKRRVTFCSTTNVICCPRIFIQKADSSIQTDELDTCQSVFKQYHQSLPEYRQGFPNIVTIEGESASRCLATLISKRTVVTSASCSSSLSNGPTRAILADNATIPIERTIVHPNYRSNDKANDIALIKLTQDITLNAAVLPACVWMNSTRTPLYLRLINTGNIENSGKQVVPLYNTDCQRDYISKISNGRLCVEDVNLDANNTCYRPGDQLVWIDTVNLGVPHVIGFYSYEERCDQAYPVVFTRISVYVDWIRENI
ncbi:serine protease 53-like isoform X2 [Topomyia yanbarensis]|nr:serine protease 53-like isoform X2 [Topomyia yanbarensis]